MNSLRVLENMLRHYISYFYLFWTLTPCSGITLLPILKLAVHGAWQKSVKDTPFYLNGERHIKTPDVPNLPSESPAANDYTENIADALDRAKGSLQAAQ